MNTSMMKAMLLTASLSCSGLSYGSESDRAVAVKTDSLSPPVAERVREKAAEGVTELRRYVWITRSIHNIDLRSIAREATPPAMAGDEPAKPALVANNRDSPR